MKHDLIAPIRVRNISRRHLMTSAAALSLMAAAPPSTDLTLPPIGGGEALTTADSEGLLKVHMHDGRVLGVSSLDAPANQASPMGLAWYQRAIASDHLLYHMIRVA